MAANCLSTYGNSEKIQPMTINLSYIIYRPIGKLDVLEGASYSFWKLLNTLRWANSMCRIWKMITFLESVNWCGWFDIFLSTFIHFCPHIGLWAHFDSPYFKLPYDVSVASACFYVRICRRVRTPTKVVTIRYFHHFHVPGPTYCSMPSPPSWP